MPDSSEKPFYFFIHIPKTAGTTLRSIVDLQMGRDHVLTYYNQTSVQLLDNLKYILADPANLYQAIIGHYSFGVHHDLPMAARYISFLRDPIQLTLSAYHERLKTFPNEFLKSDGSTMTIEEHIEINLTAYANLQTKIIAEVPTSELAEKSHYELAKQNIENHFEFIGLTERFDEAILMLSKKLGWRPCLYGNLNRGPSGKEISPETAAHIKEIANFDMALYDYVESKFNAEIESSGEVFLKALTELHTQQTETDAAAQFAELPDVENYIRAEAPK